jgi:hypothetical protein
MPGVYTVEQQMSMNSRRVKEQNVHAEVKHRISDCAGFLRDVGKYAIEERSEQGRR